MGANYFCLDRVLGSIQREHGWGRRTGVGTSRHLAWSLLWTCRGCLCRWRCVPVRKQCPRHAVFKGISALFPMASSSSRSKAWLLTGETEPPSALELQSQTATLCSVHLKTFLKKLRLCCVHSTDLGILYVVNSYDTVLKWIRRRKSPSATVCCWTWEDPASHCSAAKSRFYTNHLCRVKRSIFFSFTVNGW